MAFKVPEENRITTGQFKSTATDGNNGAFEIDTVYCNQRKLFVIASDGAGWEHVSVSTKNHGIPHWYIMCMIKKMFWGPEDCVVQYHPPESEYVNNCGTCLHLWRPVGIEVPRPPAILVGVK